MLITPERYKAERERLRRVDNLRKALADELGIDFVGRVAYGPPALAELWAILLSDVPPEMIDDILLNVAAIQTFYIEQEAATIAHIHRDPGTARIALETGPLCSVLSLMAASLWNRFCRGARSAFQTRRG
jgi:hypothetical protein